MKTPLLASSLILGLLAPSPAAKPSGIEDIKAYCLDFNWGARRKFAAPGSWCNAEPAAHVAWYQAMGANVIQTFCVSCNGYAWYKGGVVPEQPGLKHDFLPEVVRLGHRHGMLVMGYFCIAANTRWGAAHPDLSYGTPATCHLPYTDEYLACLARWNNQDATKVVPEALAADVGLYGFAKPRQHGSGLIPLDGILSRPVAGLKGDDRNIAVLARAYHGVSIDAARNDQGEFVEPGS